MPTEEPLWMKAGARGANHMIRGLELSVSPSRHLPNIWERERDWTLNQSPIANNFINYAYVMNKVWRAPGLLNTCRGWEDAAPTEAWKLQVPSSVPSSILPSLWMLIYSL